MSTKLLFALAVAVPAVFAAPCERLSELSLPDTTITKAEAVAAGAFTLPNLNAAQQGAFRGLPAFCRVAATIRPTSDSEIKIEVWMPAEGWNRKFMGVGNGGWSGAIVYPALATALGRGYAAASTNTGHDGGDASFVPGHPEKLVDFAYRAVHEMTVKAKAVTEAYYGNAPSRAYWNGCSSGGKQGLKESQKFPRDYDGIIAGAPANYWTHLMAGDLWPAVVTRKDPAASLPPAKLEVLHKAALAACDKLDGVEDGLLENPTGCRFDPATVQCKGAAAGKLSDFAASGSGAKDLRRRAESQNRQADLSGYDAGQRTRVDRARRTRAVRHPGFPLPARGVQQAGLGFPDARLRQGRGAGGQARQRPDRSHRPQSEGVLRARRQVDRVSRMERSTHHAAQLYRLLQQRGGEVGRRGQNRLVVPPFYGTRDEPLWRRGWTFALRCGFGP